MRNLLVGELFVLILLASGIDVECNFIVWVSMDICPKQLVRS